MSGVFPLVQKRAPGVLAVAALLATALIGAVVAIALTRSDSPGGPAAVDLPEGWRSRPLSPEDSAAGVVLSAQNESADATYLARAVIGALPHGFDISALAAETEGALAAATPGFALLGREVATLAGVDSLRITYTQADGYQYELTVVPTPGRTYYFVLRAPPASLAGLRPDGEGLSSQVLSGGER